MHLQEINVIIPIPNFMKRKMKKYAELKREVEDQAMWIVAKIKKKELNIFKKKLIDKFGKEVKFYYPIIQYYQQSRNKIKKIEKFVLENYIFCNHIY